MADAPESPPLAGENKSAVGARFPERPLDLDVRSSTGPYPRPRPPRRDNHKKIWLAAGGAAVILGLSLVLFSSHEDPLPPLPSAPPEAMSLTPEGSPPDTADRTTEDNLGFTPVSTPPEDKPEPTANQELTAEPPPQATASTEPGDKPARTADAAKPTAKPAAQTAASAKPAAKPAQANASPKPAYKPTAAETQPAAASPTEKPAAGASEISDKWVVNISSTPDAAESLRFLSTLEGQDVGGKVYASEAVLEGRTQHRIRVGFFDTREEAEAVGLKIKEQYRLYATPWAVRPSKEEESKYGGGR